MELSSQDVIYNIDFKDIDLREDKLDLPEYKWEVYENIRTALEIEDEGYNVYLIDDFSKVKLKNLKEYIEEILKNRDKPKDICYVIKEDPEKPYPLYISNGKGHLFKKTIEEIQNFYFKSIYEFYNSSTNKKKEEIIENIQKKRSELINELMSNAHKQGFDLRSTTRGFTFIPITNGEIMTEKEYDALEPKSKEEILKKVNDLKIKSAEILDSLKNIETVEVEKIKKIMNEFLKEQSNRIKEKYRKEFYEDEEVVKFLDEMCEEIENDACHNYSMIYEDDEDKINEIIMRYDVNILVDNSKYDKPRVIFEEDPNVINLLGNIEYKNQNGTYVTDLSLIKGGSVLKANEGCLIIRANSLLSNPTAYYNLKKTIMSGKLNFNYNRGYAELISLSSLDPEPIKLKQKIIMIGDYETYDILFNYDEDFKKIFKIKAQYNPIVNIDHDTKFSLINNINRLCDGGRLKKLDEEAIKEVAKYLSRKAENRNKFYIDNDEIRRIITICSNKVEREGKEIITKDDIIKIIYKEDLIEKEIREYYEEKKILLSVKGKRIGQINGLSVVSTGYLSFGKPIRITCSCCKGEGEIIDVQKQSDLSGNIHSKAVNILKGYINEILGRYDKLPVNFHLSFEQIYGKIDGDSASVAELISMISALSNMPIKQNIAVTGSINQFGDVQAIGGVNEKIEGFFKVCKVVDSIEGKGALIPYSNKMDLILNDEVENAIKDGKFHIYTMNTVKDAINILMGDYDEVMNNVKKELKKYGKKGKTFSR
ncbi:MULTISPECIES: AAA family ATPase [Clostridium]|nr:MULTISPECIES: AAA family ATPase [Clostridium]MBE6044758.1 ATP-dependent protease [Clostridium thermopalmarium]